MGMTHRPQRCETCKHWEPVKGTAKGLCRPNCHAEERPVSGAAFSMATQTVTVRFYTTNSQSCSLWKDERK